MSGISFENSLRAVIGILELLDYCHSLGRLHRDVKPCHVLIVGDRYDEPYLIDFGIGYADEDIVETATGEGKGNRFLVGPEHVPSGTPDNRNAATDVCQCLGLLYYALTNGIEPGVLLDSNQRKPHQRNPIPNRQDIEDWQNAALRLIFDRGFEWHPLNRWKSARELADRLKSIADPTDRTMMTIQSMANGVTSDGLVARKLRYQQIANDLESRIETIAKG